MGSGKGQAKRISASSTKVSTATTTKTEVKPSAKTEVKRKRRPVDTTSMNYRLGMKALNGDLKAQGELIERNMPWAIKKAMENQGLGLENEDLKQEAHLGLMRAAQDWDPRVSTFTTYATWWINQNLRRSIEQKGTTNKHGSQIPSYLYAIMGKVKKEMKNAEKNEEKIDLEKLKKRIDEPAERVEAAYQVLTRRLVSMDQEVGGEDEPGATIGSLIPNEVSFDEKTEEKRRRKLLKNALLELTEDERFVLLASEGAFGEEKLKQNEIIEALNARRGPDQEEYTRGKLIVLKESGSKKIAKSLQNEGVSRILGSGE